MSRRTLGMFLMSLEVSEMLITVSKRPIGMSERSFEVSRIPLGVRWSLIYESSTTLLFEPNPNVSFVLLNE